LLAYFIEKPGLVPGFFYTIDFLIKKNPGTDVSGFFFLKMRIKALEDNVLCFLCFAPG
jgi:hypothetical protein